MGADGAAPTTRSLASSAPSGWLPLAGGTPGSSTRSQTRVTGGNNGGTRSGTGGKTRGNSGIAENISEPPRTTQLQDSLRKRDHSWLRRGPLKGWRQQGRGGSNPPFRTIRLGHSLRTGLAHGEPPAHPKAALSCQGGRVEWCVLSDPASVPESKGAPHRDSVPATRTQSRRAGACSGLHVGLFPLDQAHTADRWDSGLVHRWEKRWDSSRTPSTRSLERQDPAGS